MSWNVLAAQAAAVVATATTRPTGPVATAANVVAALHDLAPRPVAVEPPGEQPLSNGGMGSAVADPLDFLLTQMSLSLDELELPELPSL